MSSTILKRFVFDLDGTLCFTEGNDYANSVPRYDRIAVVNSLYDDGNTIIIYTARGMGRFNNDELLARAAYENLTVSQLVKWGVRYSNLFLGKPAGDIYIDDKGQRDIDFFSTHL